MRTAHCPIERGRIIVTSISIITSLSSPIAVHTEAEATVMRRAVLLPLIRRGGIRICD